MLTFLKLVAVTFAMFMIIPLTVWAGSGSLRVAWHATKRFFLIMGCLYGAGALMAGIYWLSAA